MDGMCAVGSGVRLAVSGGSLGFCQPLTCVRQTVGAADEKMELVGDPEMFKMFGAAVGLASPWQVIAVDFKSGSVCLRSDSTSLAALGSPLRTKVGTDRPARCTTRWGNASSIWTSSNTRHSLALGCPEWTAPPTVCSWSRSVGLDRAADSCY